jgi:hypothetical protein
MQEVTKQLGPLADRVSLLSNNIERLYNSNGGPPGFLQTARKEDDGRFQMIFDILDEHKQDIQPIKDFIRDRRSQDETRAEDQDKLSKKLNVRLVVLGLVIGALQLFGPSIQGCRKAASSLLDPPAHSQLEQHAIIPPLAR